MAGHGGSSVGLVDGDDFDDDDLVLLSVADVRVAVPAGNGVEAGLVVLEEAAEPHRQLRMYVGQPEARAIHVSWARTVPPRPSTWDLFISTISLLDARIDQAVITDVEDQRHYFAQLLIHRAEDDVPVRLTARPSDAIALALRGYGAKLYARPHVLDEAGLLEDGSHWVRPPAEPVPFPDEPLRTEAQESDAETEESTPGGAGDRVPEGEPDHADRAAADEAADGPAADGPATDETAADETAADETAAEPASPGPDADNAATPDALIDRPRERPDWNPPAPPAPDRRAEAAGRAAAARSARSFRGRPPSPDEED